MTPVLNGNGADRGRTPGPDGLDFLRQLAEATTRACRVEPGMEAAPRSVNQLPHPAVLPGARGCYPAVWTQDFTMIFCGGCLTNEDGLNHLRLILGCQNGEGPRRLTSGAWIPPHAIPDHILLDGRPVFFPGTYSPDDDQGGEPWGITPPFNNHYDVIRLAHMLVNRTGETAFLRETINGVSLFERLRLAYEVPTTDPRTGVVCTTAEERAVGFIFCDSIYMTGSLLTASLLRVRASRHMAELASALARHADAEFFRQQAALTASHIPDTFACDRDAGVWLKACTGISAQPDVWGSIYAIYIDSAEGPRRQSGFSAESYSNVLPPDTRAAVLRQLAAALRSGTIEFEGALRHVPLDRDASAHSAWERTPTPHNRYQNGAYWHMPSGWLISILKADYPELAQALANRFVAHMRQNAFTRGESCGAPWECIGRDGAARQNPVFGPSITVPLAAMTGGTT